MTMMSAKFELVSGGDLWERKFAGMKAVVKGGDLRRIAAQAGQVVAEAMKANIHRLTGRTEESIAARAFEDGSTTGVSVGPNAERFKIGRLLEFGHVTPGGTHVPAYPWSRPAQDSAGGEAETLLQDGVVEALDNA